MSSPVEAMLGETVLLRSVLHAVNVRYFSGNYAVADRVAYRQSG